MPATELSARRARTEYQFGKPCLPVAVAVDERAGGEQNQGHHGHEAVVAAGPIKDDAGKHRAAGGADLVHNEAKAENHSGKSWPGDFIEHHVLNSHGAKRRTDSDS